MCDFIFVSPDASLMSATRADGSPARTEELQSPRMEDSASTVICGTPPTSRTPRLTPKRKLYGKLVSMMKLVLPGKRKSKKAFGTKKSVTFKDQVTTCVSPGFTLCFLKCYMIFSVVNRSQY